MNDLCEAATEAMLTLRRREAEYRVVKVAAGPPQWRESLRRGAARHVRDAGVQLRERLDRYVSAKEDEAQDRPGRRNP